MDITSVIAFISSLVAVGSMILNWVQYRSSKKGTELSNLDKQLEIIEKLQAAKDEGYKEALKNKDLQIEQCKNEIKNLKQEILNFKQQLGENRTKINTLQNGVNKLIAGGCLNDKCPVREAYSFDDVHEMFDTEEAE